MPYNNKYLLTDKRTLAQNKIESLLQKVTDRIQAKELQNKESVLSAVSGAINEYHKSFNTTRVSSLDYQHISPNKAPLPEEQQLLWEKIKNDIDFLFAEVEGLELLLAENFNSVITDTNRLNGRIKESSSLLGDYILYASQAVKDSVFFKDSFISVSKVDVGSSLLTGSECSLIPTEGIVTLPTNLEKSTIINITETPVLSGNSNGSIGNSKILTRSFNGDILDILDGNPDTVFEYERIDSKTDANLPLILDFTVLLSVPEIINFIRVNPYNFGTKTVIDIIDIRTSFDGEVYTSIKDDIPIAGAFTEDEENIFILSPSTSKYSGQGIYTFTPRKVKYVNFVFKQHEAYVVSIDGFSKQRYAIGLRDIEIKRIAYESKGELISKSFKSLQEIRKIAITTNQNPFKPSALSSIKYYLSSNGGSSWNEIQTQDWPGVSGGVSIPEIINFNGPESNSIKTPAPVKEFKLKIAMERFDQNFKVSSSSLNSSTEPVSELQSLPSDSPFEIVLNRTPVDGTVTVIDPLYGSRGISDSPFIVGRAENGIIQSKYSIPFKNFNRPLNIFSNSKLPISSAEWIYVEVGGQRWSHADQPLSSYSPDPTLEVYRLDPINGILEFGDGVTTKAIPSSALITIYFNEEQLFLSEDLAHTGSLEFITSSNKEDIEIIQYGKIVSGYSESIPDGIYKHNLTHSIVTSVSGGGITLKTYINGTDELTISGDYSIDYANGIYYSFDPTDGTSLSYNYREHNIIPSSNWSWNNTGRSKREISLNDSDWVTLSSVTTVDPSTINYFNLDHGSLVKGSMEFSLDGDRSSASFNRELDFINGILEFEVLNELIGAYSVDYKTGRVYLQSSLVIASSLECSYAYSNYKIRYRIARELQNNSYSVNVAAKSVTLTDSAILKKLDLQRTLVSSDSPFYLINYESTVKNREDIPALKDYFSPVLKDYTLKVITKDKLI